MAHILKDKGILVTGGTGSIGSEIIRHIIQYEPRVIRVLSNDENGLFQTQQQFQEYPNIIYFVGDIKDKERIKMAAERIDFIFHAAALKHVPLCEYNPFEALKTNVLGTQNVIEVAREIEAEGMIAISTDKAVNPVNVMGATKLLAERLVTSANQYKGLRKTFFSCVRFGNVIDSRGSIVPIFRDQIKKGGPVTITDPNMTRFIMSIPKAVELVIKATEIAHGGEIFIFKMPSLKIGDLARVMIDKLAPVYGHNPKKIETKIIGSRVGEKSYEELMTLEEAENASEIEDMFIVQPSYRAKSEEKNKNYINALYSYDENLLLSPEQMAEALGEILITNNDVLEK